MSTTEDLKKEVAAACRVLAHRQLAHDIIGHVSARSPGHERQMLLRCRGPRESGLIRTSSDSIRTLSIDEFVDPGDGFERPLELPIHGSIYQRRPDVSAVVHAHPPFAVLCGVAGIELRPVYGAFDSDGMLLVNEGIPMFESSRLINSWDTGSGLADVLAAKNACLLRGHGTVTVGRSVGEAMLRTLRLERICWFTWQLQLSGQLGNVRDIDAPDLAFFTDPTRVNISKNTEWRWQAYMGDVADPVSDR